MLPSAVKSCFIKPGCFRYDLFICLQLAGFIVMPHSATLKIFSDFYQHVKNVIYYKARKNLKTLTNTSVKLVKVKCRSKTGLHPTVL